MVHPAGCCSARRAEPQRRARSLPPRHGLDAQLAASFEVGDELGATH
jgi:hypothetical protein